MRITELFDNGEFVVTAEVGPPKGFHLEHLVEEATTYLSGITAVNVTDNNDSFLFLFHLFSIFGVKLVWNSELFHPFHSQGSIARNSSMLCWRFL